MKRNNATNHIRVATKSPSSEAVDIDSPSPEGVERALQCTTDDPSTPSAAATTDQSRQEHARQASAIDGSKVATSTSATDRCCNDSTNNKGLLAEVTEELDEANAEAANIGERRQTLLGRPSFMTTSRNDERHPLAFAAELIAEMDIDNDDVDDVDDVDDGDDGDKSIM